MTVKVRSAEVADAAVEASGSMTVNPCPRRGHRSCRLGILVVAWEAFADEGEQDERDDHDADGDVDAGRPVAGLVPQDSADDRTGHRADRTRGPPSRRSCPAGSR